MCKNINTWNVKSLSVSNMAFQVCRVYHTWDRVTPVGRAAMGSRTLKCAKTLTPGTSNHCPSARMLSKCGRCSGAIYSQYNMGNLLSLSREGDITSSRKGIVDNLSMTYDGCRLVSVSDSAPGPSVTRSADFRDGVVRGRGVHL